jgi:imidazolonepropionase-like amidohydrolase
VHRTFIIALAGGLAACGGTGLPPADVILTGGRVYTLSWPDPDGTGRPSRDAPYSADGWQPDAEALAIIGDRIIAAGSGAAVDLRKGPNTRVIDLKGATVIPGLIDSHVRPRESGRGPYRGRGRRSRRCPCGSRTQG